MTEAIKLGRRACVFPVRRMTLIRYHGQRTRQGTQILGTQDEESWSIAGGGGGVEEMGRGRYRQGAARIPGLDDGGRGATTTTGDRRGSIEEGR